MRDAWFQQCSQCGAEYELVQRLYVCPACASSRPPGDPLCGVLETRWRPERLARQSRPDLDEIRDTRELAPWLPVDDANAFPPLAMPLSPLYPAAPDWPGNHQVYLKDDTRQPTGSYKDRASLLVLADAVERGCDTICAASTGNAGSSLAGLAAAADMRAVLLVPAAAPAAKLTQIVAYGAKLIPVTGSYDDAFELSLQLSEQTGWINRNTAWHPFTIEGKKTAALEIGLQLDWQVPDLVFVPCGDGVIISGLYKGWRDCRELGWIDRLPRLIAVQAAGSSVIVDALADPELRHRAGTQTAADSICVDAPRNLDLALAAIRDTDGDGVKLTEEEIAAAVSDLARCSGVFAEPAAAATWGGARKWLAAHQELESQRCVVMITGSGLKAVDRISAAVSIPPPVAADPQAVLAAALNQASL